MWGTQMYTQTSTAKFPTVGRPSEEVILWTWRDAFGISHGYGVGSHKFEITVGAWLFACFRLQSGWD